MKIQQLLYRLAFATNDVRAIRRGTVGKRLMRKFLWRTAGKVINRVTR